MSKFSETWTFRIFSDQVEKEYIFKMKVVSVLNIDKNMFPYVKKYLNL